MFKKYSKKDKINSSNKNVVQILEELNILLPNNKKDMTRHVKTLLTKLGHKNKRKVYARIYPETEWKTFPKTKILYEIGGIIKEKFRNTEWLYDLHWYTDKNDIGIDKPEFYSMPKTFDLACECEWSKNEAKTFSRNKKDIEYDFQKLLFSSAILNLFICRCHDDEQLSKLFNYFNNAVLYYENKHANYEFLIVCYMKNEIHYTVINKNTLLV